MTTSRLRTALLEFLSTLPGVDSRTQRNALLRSVGLAADKAQIATQGTDWEFANSLLETLEQRDKPALLQALDQLSESAGWLGPDRLEQLANLRADVAALTTDEWCEQFAVGTLNATNSIRAFKQATGLELRIIGSKYISELYYPRLRAEANFKHFLESDAVCFLVVAKAGRGKTNLLCHIVEQLQDQRPVLFLSGRMEPGDSYGILTHIASRLGYGEDWARCVKDIESISDSGREPLILIDGINESASDPKTMQSALRELLLQAASNGIKVCVTCRTDFWQFYRAPFWGEYTWHETGTVSAAKVVRGEDLPLFPDEDFERIESDYFSHFKIRGELVEEARDRCRNPLLLRFYCEAYHDSPVGRVSQIRLYPLFKLFWERKIGQVQDLAGLAQPYPATQLVLSLARLMHQRLQTKVPKDQLAPVLQQDLSRPDGLYFRVLDEEIILEEEVDNLLGTTNVIFVYDKLAEFAIALSVFVDREWSTQSAASIVADAQSLMQEEEEKRFATLRGALEFLVLLVEDRRLDSGIHFDIVRTMLNQDWKWRHAGSVLAFQLTHTEDAPFWTFMSSLTGDERGFVRRICAEQLGQLARYQPEKTLQLLNQCLGDKSSSVREAARDSLLSLDAASAIQEARILLTQQPLGAESRRLAAQIMLWPGDQQSPLLQEKAHWLVSENRDDDLQQAVLEQIADLGLSPYEDLYVLEELEAILRACHEQGKPSSAYLTLIDQQLSPRKQALDTDLERLEAMRTTINRLFDFTVDALDMRRREREAILSAPLNQLMPDKSQQREFLQHVAQLFQVARSGLPREASSLTLGELGLELARRAAPFGQEPAYPCLIELPGRGVYFDYYQAQRLLRLCQIANDLLAEAARLSKLSPDTTTVSTRFEAGGFALDPDQATSLRVKKAAKIGAELSKIGHRELSTVGRLALWLWQAEGSVGEHERQLEQTAEEVLALDVKEIAQRLSVFQSSSLSEQGRTDLALTLQALCRAHAGSLPNKVAEGLSPLIIWHDENDSPVLGEVFQGLYWSARNCFWDVANSLLEQPDQRVVDFASQMLERAEYVEQQAASSGVFEQIRGIVAELLALDPSRVVPTADLRRDLECDSLDLVEMVMAIEDEFGFEISDADAERIKTVDDVVTYTASRLA